MAIGLDRDLCANRPAQRHHAVIDDPVKNMDAIAAFTNNAILVKHVEMLGHIGLCRLNFLDELADVLFAIAQAADDFQARRRRHDTKQFGGAFENLV